MATAGTYIHFNGQPRVYASSATLYVGSGSDLQGVLGTGGPSSGADRTLADLAQLVSSPPVAAAAARLIGNPRELGSVSAAPAAGTDFISLSSEGPSPHAAAASVNAYAAAFIQFRTNTIKQEAQTAINGLQSQLRASNDPAQSSVLQGQISQLQQQVAHPTSSLQQVASAGVNPTPLSPSPKKDALFALVLSLMLGMALAYGLDRLDRRVRSEEELKELYGVPVLAEIPRVMNPIPSDDGVPYVDREQWESFRALRTHIELAVGSRPLRTLLVASAQPAEGKSLVVRNLALAFADAGARVAIVDADLRRSSISKILNVEANPGVAEVLTQPEVLRTAIQRVERVGQPVPAVTESEGGLALATIEVTQGSLDVLAAGGPMETRAAAVAAAGIKTVLSRMTEAYDVVLIDSAPLLAVSDSVPFLSDVDGVVLVARVGTTTTEATRRITELLSRVPDARVLGVVANGVSKQAFHYGAGYEA